MRVTLMKNVVEGKVKKQVKAPRVVLDLEFLWNHDEVVIDEDGLKIDLMNILPEYQIKAHKVDTPEVIHLTDTKMHCWLSNWERVNEDEYDMQLEKLGPYNIFLSMTKEIVDEIYTAWKDYICGDDEIEDLSGEIEESIMEVVRGFKEEILADHNANIHHYSDVIDWVSDEVANLTLELERKLEEKKRRWK